MMRLPGKLQSGTDVRQIRDWLNALRDYCLHMTPKGDGKTIRVNGGCISAVRGAGQGGGGSGAYTGPFTLQKKDDTTISLLETAGTNRYSNYVVIDQGNSGGEDVVAAQDVVFTPGSGEVYVCLDFWYDPDLANYWKFVVLPAAYVYPRTEDCKEAYDWDYPAEIERVTRYVLGQVHWQDTEDPPNPATQIISSVTQWQYGIINAKSRSY